MKALKSLLTNGYSTCIITVCGLKVLLNQDQFQKTIYIGTYVNWCQLKLYEERDKSLFIQPVNWRKCWKNIFGRYEVHFSER